MTDAHTEALEPCPFCGKQPVRVSIGTASCDGMVDGKEIHNTIGMRPACWNARAAIEALPARNDERALKLVEAQIAQYARTIVSRYGIFQTADDNFGRAAASAEYRLQNSEVARCYLRLLAALADVQPTGETR